MLDPTTEIGRLIHDDHMVTLATLQSLESFLARGGGPADPTDPATRALMQDLAAVTATEVGRHFGFEERELFPLMSTYGQSGMVQLLTMEHRAILPVAEEVGRLVRTALDDGLFTPDDWAAFEDGAAELMERELFHIQKEEMGLLAAVASLLTPEEDARLAATFRALAAAEPEALR